MARPRRTVPTLQEAIQVQPQASVAVGQVPTAARPDIPIYDFAPISESISGYLAKQARDDAEKKIQAGERWAVENPALVADIERDMASIKDAKERALKTKEAFAFLQRNGQIVAPADPFWQVGYSRAAGRQLGAEYRSRLQARLNEVSNIRDPNGSVTEAPDLERIMSEEWERMGQAPAVQNFYGGKEALAAKAQADEEFRAAAAQRRAAKQEVDYQDMLTREIGGRFDQLIAANPVVTSETLQPITDYLTEEVRGHNVMNPRELTMQALELSIQRLQAVDADEAVRAVHAAQDLVVGDVRLGDDRGEVGLRLQELTQRVRENAKNADLRAIQETNAKRALAVQKGEAEYLPMLLQAKQEGHSVQDIARRLSAEYLTDADNKFDGNGAFVAQALQDTARQIDATRDSDGQVLDQFNLLIADGNLNAAEALARSAMLTGSLTGKDYGEAIGALNSRRGVSKFVEESGTYQAVKQRYAQSKPTGFAPDVQQRIDDDAIARERRLERDFVAFVRTTEGKPNREDLHRQWLAEREAADEAEIQKFGLETRAKGESAIRDIRQKLARYQDAGDLINTAELEGTLSIAEAQKYRELRDQAVANRESFFTTPAYRDAQSILDAEFDRLEAGEPSPETLAARRTAQDEFRDRFSVALDAMLADPASTPATYEARARSEARRVARELHGELFPSPEGKATEVGIKAGKGAAAAVDQARLLTENLTKAREFEAAIASPGARERMTGAMFKQVPELAEPVERLGGTWNQNKNSFYDYAAAWMSGRDPILGTPVLRSDVEDYAFEILRADPSPEAAASVLSVIGVSPQDVLRGSVTLEPKSAGEIDAQIERATSMMALVRGPGLPFTPERIQSLRDLRKPVTVSLEVLALEPYTTPFFRSEETMKLFRADPAYPDFLRKLSIDPDDEESVTEWEIHQLNAIQRTNP